MIMILFGQGLVNSESKYINQGFLVEFFSLIKYFLENFNFFVEWQVVYIMRKMISLEKWQIEVL